MTSLSVHGGLLEHLIHVLLGANAHVLLTKSLDVLADVCALLWWLLVDGQSRCGHDATHKLLRERNLLELHLVDTSRSRAKQRTGCHERTALHLVVSVWGMCEWRKSVG